MQEEYEGNVFRSLGSPSGDILSTELTRQDSTWPSGAVTQDSYTARPLVDAVASSLNTTGVPTASRRWKEKVGL
jgi:hypothetical protein